MKPTTLALLSATALALLTVGAFAEKGADLKPLLVKPGKLIADEKFSGTSLPKGWVANKGDWQVRDGAVIGKEKASDEHAAVLTLARPIRDAVLSFSFKADGAKGFNVSLNHAKGHLFRIALGEEALTITKDKDKNDPASKPVPLGRTAAKFAPGKWHTVLIEFHGSKVCVQADNGAKLEASHPELDVDKTGYRFVVRGESLLLSDLKAWQAAAGPVAAK
ncbi:MAG: hypothetical protein FJ386_07050 [Verrucomicrobia bacterium]|nr:hypothetical protein [Verrucomicrobiota bacterium]